MFLTKRLAINIRYLVHCSLSKAIVNQLLFVIKKKLWHVYVYDVHMPEDIDADLDHPEVHPMHEAICDAQVLPWEDRSDL